MNGGNHHEKPMQKGKTKEYWNTFYSALPSIGDSTDKCPASSITYTTRDDHSAPDIEWILPSSQNLLDVILNSFPSNTVSFDEADQPVQSVVNGTVQSKRVDVLEIGCGVSQLSRSLLQRLLHKNINQNQAHQFDFVAADISTVCIEHNRKRDSDFVASLDNADGSLHYKVLDALEERRLTSSGPSYPIPKYDIILDKGTLDTFLFRSKRTKKGSTAHPPLLTHLLNNIHSWLRNSCGSKYIIISPRSKIKSVRDFQGFASVRRKKIDIRELGSHAVLVKGNGEHASVPKSNAYVYECVKNDSYSPDRHEPYSNMIESTSNGKSSCVCGLSFKEFLGNNNTSDQGEVVWTRRWINHRVHCKGAHGRC
ncbi:hypothetical protein ACHAWF_010517 [Thalassiosira exigua]